ncbi:hypothetical protein RchiOBHm_Chr2g0165211 [Rosa chinensis]|uniref:Uncharacterized protein n=1 Tax=Rosa chinensis TaxID=74649 RepID=A0A2P6S3R4_ROSCH|nr:hypothetical protein RchiOBHm_Chr2g0165211 [Rosa chinensis]
MARHSGALVVLVMMIMVSWSNCMMSNKSIASTTAGNSTAAASSAWCNGRIIDGQCMLVADAAYSGGEHLDLNLLDVKDMVVVVEYYDSGESSRRVLAGVPGQGNSYLSLKPNAPVNDARNNKYIKQNCGTYTRSC